MTKIKRSADCGNSRKNQLVENLAVALATGDRDTVSALVTDDVQWTIAGGDEIAGRESMLAALEEQWSSEPDTLIIHHVVTHGRAGAVDGTVTLGDRTVRFCDVFDFSSTKGTAVGRILSYRVAL
jgi:ketosteroid isomerase-like protein